MSSRAAVTDAARPGRLRRAAAALCALALSGHAAHAGEAAPSPSAVLFHNVDVVTMTAPGLQPGRDVLVRDGRIARIAPAGEVPAPAGAAVIEGRGRYLMPGLAEMHAHVPGPRQRQYAHDVLFLYLAHGVTTIRGMLGDPWHLELREQLQRHEVLGPRLYTAGPSLNGQSAPEPERARQMVSEQHAAGYDFVKLHPGLTPPVFAAIDRTADAVGITFEGHVSEAVGLERALAARQRAIDHLDGYVQGLAHPQCLAQAQSHGVFGAGVVHCIDMARLPDLVARTKAAGTWMVPTQILLEQWVNPPDEAALRARPAVRYVPDAQVADWLARAREMFAGQGLTAERGRRFIEVRRELIRRMHAAGVPILLGSDAPQIFNVPGDSALEELRLYAAIGLGPYEALRTATSNPARFFGAGDRFGAVREGLDADLLLLEENPLEDVRAVRSLAGVMVRGRWLPRSEIDARLDEIAARAGRQAFALY